MSDFSNNNYNNISSALKKAREVAAKLQITGQNKRSQEDFDDSEPHSKRFQSGSMSPAHLQQAQHAAAQVAARLGQQNNYQQQHVVPNPDAVEKAKQLISKFIPQGAGGMGNNGGQMGQGSSGNGGMSRPGLGASGASTEIMIPGSKVGLIIGKGGETIKQLQERTGAKMVVIQDGPGQEMEKPLRISGDPQKVEHAKQLVYELLEDKGNPQQSQGGGNRNNYNNRGGQEHGGNGGGHGNNYANNGGDQIEVFVPRLAVGVVIGKGGDMIKKIQADTGCRLQFIQTKNEGPGDRRCILQGSKQEVDDGKQMIEDLIDSVMRRQEGGGGNGGGRDNWNNSNNSSGYQQHQQNSSPMSGSSSGGGGVQVTHQQYQFVVPASKCGIIIGRGGDTIKAINTQTKAHCEMDRKVSQNQTNEKTFTIKGEQHAIDDAKRLIQEKINMEIELVHIGSTTVTQSANGQGGANPYGQTWGAGNGGYNQGAAAGWDQNAGGPPMQGAPGGNQADYSLQWIEYYRSMGMHQQAEAIEAQVKTRPAAGAPPAAMMPGGSIPQPQQPQASGGGSQDNVRDYSQEWANYYRQIGRNDEAEAIERQIKTRGTATGGASGPPGAAYPGAGDANYQQPQQQQAQYQQQPTHYGQYGNYNYTPYGQNPNDKNCQKRYVRCCIYNAISHIPIQQYYFAY